MSNVTQNNQNFWPHTMDVTKDGKTNFNNKSSFMHNLLHKVICFIVWKCLLISSTLKWSNKSLPLVIEVKIMFRDGNCNVHRRQIKRIYFLLKINI